jgi:hypothetical protein
MPFAQWTKPAGKVILCRMLNGHFWLLIAAVRCPVPSNLDRGNHGYIACFVK